MALAEITPANDIDTTPCSMEAEQALLGCVIYDNGAYERVLSALKADHFHEPFHGRVWTAIEEHIRKGQLAEPIVLMERFKRDPTFIDLGGMRYFAELVDRAPLAASAPDLSRIIFGHAQRREMLRLAGDIEHAVRLGEVDPGELIEQAEGELFRLGETGTVQSGPRAFSDVLTDALDTAADAYSRAGALTGISTGLSDLDHKLGGLHPSDLIIIAGRPSMGKSALATNIAFHAARHYRYEESPAGERKTVEGGIALLFSLEMSDEQMALRILAEVSGVPSDKIRRGEIEAHEFGKLRDAALEIQRTPLYIDSTGGLNLGKLCARARRLKRSIGLDLIVVDYLQLITTDRKRASDGRVQEVSEITQGLKALAKELNVPVVALSQLSRQVESREDKRPMLSDLRESGSIEQDADVVMFVYRESYYLERAEPKESGANYAEWCAEMEACRNTAEVIIGKQRHGPIGTVKVSFNPDLTKFGNLAQDKHFTGRLPYGERD